MSKRTLELAIETIERLTNGIDWFLDMYPQHHSDYDDEEKEKAAVAIANLKRELSEDTCELVGIKDGKATNLGTITTPPRMKLKEIVRTYFGGDVDDEMSDAALALAAGEDFLIWLMKNGWKPQEMVVTK